MALMPKRVKYRKTHRGRVRGIAARGNKLAFGDYGLMALELGRIPAQQIEACRLSATRFIGNEGKLTVRIFPHKSFTKKPQETHMGTGKGDPAYYAALVKPGTVMYELSGVTEDFARECFLRLAYKIPVKTKFVTR